MRLDKYIANATALTRSQARRAIRQGRVLVNGVQQRDFSHALPEEVLVELDGRELDAPGPKYIMLHKPQGVVSVTEDEQHTTILDLLDIENPDGLHAAGRLDIDTTGLVLITNDGDWSHRITSKNANCPKVYYVWLAEDLDEQAADNIRAGVLLKGDKHKTLPAELTVVTPREVRLTLTEGRYHQVKRMFAAVGNHVEQLHRESIGAIVLDEMLEPGEWRYLSTDEVQSIQG